MDDIKKHIYIYNKIFFSIAQDTVFHHNLSKGEDAIPSSSSANSDLNNLENLFHLENNKLNLLHTVIIHYRGSKILAQSIIPGLLSS
jgi:protein TIF31